MDYAFILVKIIFSEVGKIIQESVLVTDDIDQLWNKVEHPSWHMNCGGIWVTEVYNGQMYRIDKIPKV